MTYCKGTNAPLRELSHPATRGEHVLCIWCVAWVPIDHQRRISPHQPGGAPIPEPTPEQRAAALRLLGMSERITDLMNRWGEIARRRSAE